MSCFGWKAIFPLRVRPEHRLVFPAAEEAGANKTMSRVVSGLMLTVDLELEVGKVAPVDNERLEAATAGLISLCERHALPATWAVADPARSAATESIRQSWLSHEL